MTEAVMMYAEPVVDRIKKELIQRVEKIKNRTGKTPRLVALLIGDDPVSRTYVDLKRKDCADVGITSDVIDLSTLPKESSSKTIHQKIRELNDDPSVNAVIPQMPFDGRISEELVFSTLSPQKDVDGMTPHNLGKLLRKEYELENSLLPCTPKGVVVLAKHYRIPIDGNEVAVIGRSVLVGEPVRKLFQDLNATSTCYHTRSKNVFEQIARADIIIAASGRPPEIYADGGFRLCSSMVKEGCSVFSVGVRRDPKTARMLFDVDTKSLKEKCKFLTPNTGGVGAMTRACLIQNSVIATEKQLGIMP
jgi:methylenetetrahydrofolate dehydrogenase (NADP+)/methenyltetrahydrofolate cyclohydrolase